MREPRRPSLIKRPLQRTPPLADVPEGMRIYAVGDVHGRDDLLEEIATAIERDLASAPSEVVTVLLGDYVDRGPESASVLERLASGRFPTPVQALRGNHEQMLLQFLNDPPELEIWRRNGGLETLHSYGVDVSTVMRGHGYEQARDALLAAIPSKHLEFLSSTQPSATYGGYFFCHAGVRPRIPLALQRAEDLMWIRDGFLQSRRLFEKVVVHGHTPVARPDFRVNRINIDTGAFATSVLTCLVLEGAERRTMTAGKAQR
ncbi:serine/threonine protein phosphatase 1 [Roseiarcus fermentans]|uniref:Serine/threonine protein phosphatase 1 n=1 Tax=Roseiarcus fermentans TaxID=1473586 RepID=A0A366EY90_9HYPH|nr:metallophosphoesterase family protein [Roseiarcus fermentans]RBP07351.1 serine/threonine protein phosphatase 1 [Roseiarcus fermentans]